MNDLKKRARARFSGTVQGVGFRFKTIHLARGFLVCGYVKNLANGQVEVALEGRKSEIERFLSAIQLSSLEPYIRDVEIEWQEWQGEFSTFEIGY